MRILITIFSFLFATTSWSQQYFYKLYSGNSFDKGEDIIETMDSSYIVAGSSGSWGGNSQAFLMKIDTMGNFLWSHPYGGAESEEAVTVLERPGSGYYMAGMSNSMSQGNFDVMLVKTDLNGNQEWMKTYTNPAWDRITDALMTKDTGIVMVGYRQALFGSQSDMLLMRMNKNGDTLWTKTIGTIGEDQATSVTRFQDSLYIVVGDMFVPDSNLIKGCMITFNDQGTILSQLMIGPLPGNYHLSDIEDGEDKFYIVGNREVESYNHNAYKRVLDGNGVFQNENEEGDDPFSPYPADRKFSQVVFIPDPYYKISIVMEDNQFSFGSFANNLNYGFYTASNAVWLAENSTGIINEGPDQCNQITPTRDGGFISVGFNSMIVDGQNATNGGSNIFVLKYHPSNTLPIETQNVFTLNQLVETIELNQTMVELTMYPNPTSNELYVSLSEQVSGAYTVCDLMGKCLLTGKIQSNFTIETASWNQGVYFLNIGQHSFKFIKQ
jgi:hypothetical protein